MKNVGNIIVEKKYDGVKRRKKTKVTNNQAAFPVNCIAININNFCCFFSSFLYAYQFKNVIFRFSWYLIIWMAKQWKCIVVSRAMIQ